MSTGRTLYHYNAATQTRRAPGASVKQPECFIELHRFDAKQRGIRDGALVEVRSRRGVVKARAHISRQVKKGCVWMPLHFAEARANLLTVDHGDAITGTAEYKVCAVEVNEITEDTSVVSFPGSFYADIPG